MLNEIFKGMDNASEAINENFKNGSIVENGENENGSYVKFGNGLQICWKRQSVTTDVNKSTGQTRMSDILTWDYPADFISNPIAKANVLNSYSEAPFWTDGKTANLESLTFRILTVWSAPFASVNFSVMYFAIGRWKE